MVSLKKQKLFGVDLETVLEREAHTGYLVPSLVRRCVDEVERRGLVRNENSKQNRINQSVKICSTITKRAQFG